MWLSHGAHSVTRPSGKLALTRESKRASSALSLLDSPLAIKLLFGGSFALLPLSVGVSQGAVLGPNDVLGIVSHFPISFWFGLTLLCVLIAVLILEERQRSSVFYVAVSVDLGVYLFGFRILLEPIPFEGWTFLPFAQIGQLLASGHVNTASGILESYNSLPGFQILMGVLIHVTNLPSISLLTLMPLFWTFAFAVIAFGACRMLSLPPKLSFLCVALATSLWQYDFAGYEYPRLPATLILLLFFAVVLKSDDRTSYFISVAFFVSVVLTHQLTALAMLTGAVFIYLYQRKPSALVPYAGSLFVWYAVNSPSLFQLGLLGLQSPLGDFLFHVRNITSGGGSSSILLTRYAGIFQYGTLAVIFLTMVVSVFRRSIEQRFRNIVVLVIVWVLGTSIQAVIFGTGELVYRVFTYDVVPIAVLFGFLVIYSKPKLVIFASLLVIVLIFLSPITNFGNGGDQYFAPEANVDSFFALHTTGGSSFFYAYNAGFMYYFNPNLIYVTPLTSYDSMSQASFVIMSYLGTTFEGKPFTSWPNTTAGIHADLLFANGYSQIYHNL